MIEKDDAADEHRAEALLPGDAERRQPEGDERVLAHVRRHRDRPVGVEPHQQRPERRHHDRGHRARPLRDPGKRQDGRIDDDDVRHRDERRHAADDLGAHAAATFANAEQGTT